MNKTIGKFNIYIHRLWRKCNVSIYLNLQSNQYTCNLEVYLLFIVIRLDYKLDKIPWMWGIYNIKIPGWKWFFKHIDIGRLKFTVYSLPLKSVHFGMSAGLTPNSRMLDLTIMFAWWGIMVDYDLHPEFDELKEDI